MLNAFRHHGLYRALAAMLSMARATSAQRLSASRIISVHRDPDGAQSECAQRLSASRIISVGGRDGPLRASEVLNAFRHHGLYRPTADVAQEVLRVSCSTPFGITDYIGRSERAGRTGGRLVLNAFRHHGLYRLCQSAASSFSATGAQRLSASRIISVVVPHPSARPARCAQRLSASRIISGWTA